MQFDYVDKAIPTKFPCVMANMKAFFSSPLSQTYQQAYKDKYKFSDYAGLK